MFYTIYKTTNLINNKFYIGMHQTDNIQDRYLGSGKTLLKAIRKYGRKNFKKEILYIFKTYEEMVLKEEELITLELCKQEDCYNNNKGGVGRPLEYKTSKETKDKIRQSIKIYQKNNPNWKEKLKKDFKWSDTQKQNHSILQKNKTWITNPELTYSRHVYNNTLQEFLDQGWFLGRKAFIPKTKGKSIHPPKILLTKEQRSEINRKSQLGKKQSKESIQKRINKTSKEYIITTPLGETIKIKNLNEFCRNNNLTAPLMHKTAHGIQTQHKGYKIKFA